MNPRCFFLRSFYLINILLYKKLENNCYCLRKNTLWCFQDPIINITELKEIHSEINLTVPDPILIPNLHDGLEAVSLYSRVNDVLGIHNGHCVQSRGKKCLSILFLFVSQQNAKKRKMEDGSGEDKGECKQSFVFIFCKMRTFYSVVLPFNKPYLYYIIIMLCL